MDGCSGDGDGDMEEALISPTKRNIRDNPRRKHSTQFGEEMAHEKLQASEVDHLPVLTLKKVLGR